METINCPICGKNDTEIIFKKGNLTRDLINVICKNCALVYINPRPGEEEYDKFHKEEFLAEKSVTSMERVLPKLKERDALMKRTILDFLGDAVAEGQRILDIGCGFGTLVHLLKTEKKADAYGLELGDLDVKVAKEYYGLDLYHESLQNFSAKEENAGRFDVIVLHHTFEHLPDPAASLGQIKKILKPGGFLYIGVPNVMNIKKRPDIFFQIAHPFSYSPHSLQKILNKYGFGAVKFNRHAGYPGGMEVLARLEGNMVEMTEGGAYGEVIGYVDSVDKKFNNFRKIREILLFWLPKDLKIKISRFILRQLKKR